MKRLFLPNFLGLLPMVIINAALVSRLDYWSPLLAILIGAPIYLAISLWAFRRCETVPSLSFHVLKRQRRQMTFVIVGLSIAALFLVLFPLGIANAATAAIGSLTTIAILGITSLVVLIKS